jgi:hypothetical protein
MAGKLHLVRDFVLGGCLVAFVSYLANHVHSSLAGFVAGIQVGLFLIYFVSDYDESIKYTESHTISVTLLALFTFLFEYLYVVRKKGKTITLSDSFVFWLVLITLLWHFKVK